MSLPETKDLPLMILCGGKGTRLREVTEVLPKPMTPIGEQPILWHIMKSYAAFGVRRFILCLGYKQEEFIDYFMNFHLRLSDATITLGHDPKIRFHDEIEESDWEVTLARTGLDSATGLRIARASRYLKDTDTSFFLTYGDGVSDIDIAAELRSHRGSGKRLTIAAVHPPARYGDMVIGPGDSILRFEEKGSVDTSRINGGFMIVEKSLLADYVEPEGDVFFEQSPIRNAVRNGEVHAFRHDGFWQCMDTPREFQYLNDLWKTRKAPWTKFWK